MNKRYLKAYEWADAKYPGMVQSIQEYIMADAFGIGLRDGRTIFVKHDGKGGFREEFNRLVTRDLKDNPAPLKTSRADLTKAVRRYQRFTGHADMTARRMVLPAMPRAVLTVGECDGILYTTVREGRKESYIHRFAKGSRPLLAASPDGKRLYLLGGAYTFTERGIVDKKR